jgi:uncharacterized membrane protein
MRVSDFHPLLNHFTIALATIGVVLDFVGKYSNREGLRDFAWKCLKISAIFIGLSILSGFVAEATAHMEPEARSITDYHKTLSFLCLGMLGAGIIIRASARTRFESREEGAGIRGVYYTLTTVGLLLLLVTTFLGSELVYSHGVNVRPYERIIDDLPPSSTTPESLDSSNTTKEPGGLDSAR